MPKTARPKAYSDLAREIGARIQWARELVEPNRAAFARAMGVDRSTVRDFENGRRPPSIFAVIQISHLLRVTPDYVLFGRLQGQGVDAELAGKLAILHPELVGGVPFVGTPGKVRPSSTSRKPKTRDRPAA